MRVSIITINRNNKSGLERTILSVRRQTFSEYEYIVIDGASKDGSVDVLQKYEAGISFYSSEPDTGIYNAMNKGIRRANGDYLLFLNSGDELLDPSVLQNLAGTEISEDIIFGDILYEGETAPIVMPDQLTLETFLGPSIGHGAAFIRRSLFEKYGLYNEANRIVSDWEFFLLVCIKFRCSYRHISKVFTRYQKGGISVHPEHMHAQAEERNAVLLRMFPEFYGIIRENSLMKEKLAVYEQSKVIRFIRKWQGSRLNDLKNKFLRFRRI